MLWIANAGSARANFMHQEAIPGLTGPIEVPRGAIRNLSGLKTTSSDFLGREPSWPGDPSMTNFNPVLRCFGHCVEFIGYVSLDDISEIIQTGAGSQTSEATDQQSIENGLMTCMYVLFISMYVFFLEDFWRLRALTEKRKWDHMVRVVNNRYIDFYLCMFSENRKWDHMLGSWIIGILHRHDLA